MGLHIAVTAKQVLDPEMPLSSFQIDSAANRVVPPQNIPPVVNGFDENAVEAALLIKDSVADTRVTVLSVATSFSMDVMKRPLAMGADELVLLQDDAFENVADPTPTVRALVAAIRKLGDVDLVLCGRQASDWDNAQVPLGIAESLGLPVVTIASKVGVVDGRVRVARVLRDGYEVVESALPALVTVSNELGQPRYPTLRGIMGASRKTPTVWSMADLGLSAEDLAPTLQMVELVKPEKQAQCEMITGNDEEEAGRNLALRLREAKLI